MQQEELAEGLGAAFRVLTESFVPNGVEVDFSFSGDESAIPKPVESAGPPGDEGGAQETR